MEFSVTETVQDSSFAATTFQPKGGMLCTVCCLPPRSTVPLNAKEWGLYTRTPLFVLLMFAQRASMAVLERVFAVLKIVSYCCFESSYTSRMEEPGIISWNWFKQMISQAL